MSDRAWKIFLRCADVGLVIAVIALAIALHGAPQ